MAEEEAAVDMRTAADVADKAVSTQDLPGSFESEIEVDAAAATEEEQQPAGSSNCAGGLEGVHAVELMRLEAVLAALVQNKVISIKAASSKARKGFYRPRSFSSDNNNGIIGHSHIGRGQRLTSTSTGSSSHEDHHHEHHHKHHHHHHHQHRHHRKRQSDSALLSSGFFPRKRPKHHHYHHRHHKHYSKDNEDRYRRRKTDVGMPVDVSVPSYEENCDQSDRFDEMSILQETTFCGSTATLASAMPGPSNEFDSPFHNCHGHILPPDAISYCPSPTHSHSNMLGPHCDAEYLAIPMEFEDDEFLRHPELTGDLEEGELLSQKKRKKRKKKRKFKHMDDEDRPRRATRMVDPEDLPKRARWTIIATACLLLLMSVLLVGVTLRMAPIIDEMVRKQNEQHQNSLMREGGLINGLINASSTGAPSSGDIPYTTPP